MTCSVQKISVVIFIGFLFRVSNSQFSNNVRSCGTLYSIQDTAQIEFTLADEDHSANLAEDQRASEDGWNSTSSIFVAHGCKVKACNATYLDGTCHTLRQGTHSATDNIFMNNISSVHCTCEKQCKCSDVHVKKSRCGRAYLEGGCRVCNTPYTDFSLNRNESEEFPADFETKVKTIRLRKGCKLTIYSEEKFDGEETVIEEETIEDFDGEIRSYECECDDSLYKPKDPPPRPASYPPLIDVPASMDDVIKLLASDKYRHHPGLNAVRRSYRHGRSSRNAYMLLLGYTGAGKSSTINFLFDNPNVTKVGDFESTTSNIHEFRIPVPIDELGIANSELRVIDTPGLGDTRGLEQDSKFLATLDNYLSTHEELKDRIPNVVLILHPFHDKRFVGEGSPFVKMIRGLATFSKRITDENYSNVIFVLSHFCSADKKDQRSPEKRIKKFEQVIQHYSLFPRPTHIVVTENKPDGQHLPVVNGYYRLPNYEYFPRNLFEKMELVTQKGGDPIGLGVFRTGFRDSENFNVSSTIFELQNATTELSEKYLGILMRANIGNVNTEVAHHLADVWNRRSDSKMRKSFQTALPYLQMALHLRNIDNMVDVPRTTTGILNLLTALELNDATKMLLEKGLNIKSPEFPLNTIAGYSYDVFKDMPLPTSPFRLGNLQYSDIGFMIPSSLTCKLSPGTEEHFLILKTKQDYLQFRLTNLGIVGSIPVEKFTNDTKPGLNIEEFSLKDDSCSVTAAMDFRLFEFILNDKPDLTKEFVDTVKSLPSFNSTDHENVGKWQNFFNTYGTHVVQRTYGGGSIQIKLESDQPINDDFKKTMFDLVKFAEDLTFDMIGGNDESVSNSTVLTSNGTTQSLVFIGGNPDYHSGDLRKMSVTQANMLLMNWKKSLKFSPAVLTTEMRLVPISHIVKKLKQNYSEEIERATRLHFNSELIYTPPPPKRLEPPPTDRPGTPIVSEKIRILELEIQRKEQENAEKRIQLERDRAKWENDRKILELEFKKLQDELNRNATERRLEFEANQTAANQAHEERLETIKKELEAIKEKANHDAHIRELEILEKMRPRTIKDPCLKKGTKILMADMTEKPVELVKVGDMLLDKDLLPTRVLGTAHKFILDQKIYGFEEGEYFFTNNHIFVGPSGDNQSDMKLYALSPYHLYSNNPLMAYLNVTEMNDSKETTLYSLHKTAGNPSLTTTTIHKFYLDPKDYPMDTLVYDLQVDSTTGTYFANGYVCRHEIPPVEFWPNTMSLMFRLMRSKVFYMLEVLPYTVENTLKLWNMTEKIANKVEDYISKLFTNINDNMGIELDEDKKFSRMTLEDTSVEQYISRIFKYPSLATAAIRLYAKSGVVIARYLDSDLGSLLTDDEMGKVQNNLMEFLIVELKKGLRDFNV